MKKTKESRKEKQRGNPGRRGIVAANAYAQTCKNTQRFCAQTNSANPCVARMRCVQGLRKPYIKRRSTLSTPSRRLPYGGYSTDPSDQRDWISTDFWWQKRK